MTNNPGEKTERDRSRATATDVARAAGVSLSAVSRVFTPGASVSAKMRARVIAAAERLEYMPNALARSLMTQRTHLVGVILANFKNPLYLTVLEEFTRNLQNRGLRMLLLNVSSEDDLEAMGRLVLQYSVDGLVVSAGAISPFITEQCLKRRIPLVAFARRPRRGRLNIVCADNVAGGRVAAQRLIEAGHTRFGFVGGPETASTTQERGRGFAAELEEAGIQIETIVHATEYSYEAGTEAARRVLVAGVRPEAVFCASDMLAFGLLDVARHEFGIPIPDELSVIGFDDVDLAASASYRLTTIRQPIAAMVSDTVDILVRRLDNWAEDCEARIMSCIYVDRATVAPKER